MMQQILRIKIYLNLVKNHWIEIDFNDKESGQFEMLKQINFYLTEGFYYAQEAS